MPAKCVCQWEKCKEYSEAFKKAGHVLSGVYQVSFGPNNRPVREMIEKHLFAQKKSTTYYVAYHHWPMNLIIKNIQSKRPIRKLIDREEAAQYGHRFVEHSNRCVNIMRGLGSDAQEIMNEKNAKQYVQAPIVQESEVSFLIGTLTSRRGERAISRTIIQELSEVSSSNTIAESASKSMIKPAAVVTVSKVASYAAPPPTNLPTAQIPFSTPIRNLAPAATFRQPIFDESPEPVQPLDQIYGYIKHKARQLGAAECLTNERVLRYFNVLQKIHCNFEPITCYSSDSSRRYFYPCCKIRGGDDTCQMVNMQYYQKSGADVYCDTCAPLVKKI